MEMIAHLFIDAFNRRDAEGLVVLSDPAIELRPTSLVGERRIYHGHDGRGWVRELESSAIGHEVRVREVRTLDPHRFLLLSEVTLGGESLSSSAMLAQLTDHGKILQAHAYLSDEELLTHLGLAPQAPTTSR